MKTNNESNLYLLQDQNKKKQEQKFVVSMVTIITWKEHH